ncbi:MAG: amino acid ABC transporter permease [Acidimicrobiia bacterium]
MTVELREHQKTPLWRNAQFLKWAVQLVVLAGFVALFAILANRAVDNFNARGTTFGWDWLTDPSDFLVREGIDLDPDSGIRALAVGAINTLRVTVFGIIAATVLGILVGVGRLSSNWIVEKISTIYIETIRNIPLLLQIIFWQAMAITLPDLTEADLGEYFFKASNKGFGFIWFQWQTGFLPWLTFLAAGLIAGRYVSHRRRRHQEETGQPAHSGYYALGTLAVFALVGWFFWPVLSFLSPVFHGIADFIDEIPAIVIPIVIALAALLGAAMWIRNFFESRRTPAGFGKLSDDDWFRVIFAGVSGIVGAVLAFVICGLSITTVAGEVLTIAELIRTGFSNIFDWLGRGFANESSNPLSISKASVIQRGSFVQYGDTGAVMTVSFFAVWFGVTLYTASFIAEIVRGGILAVSKGQTEAAQAVGLKRSQLLRLIVLPQAFRIILPPIGNQYLNLFKNTSLGIAVAYAEIVAVGFTLLNKNGQTLPIVLVWMAFFLTGSLIISSIVNYYNRKLKLVER